jgi:hypothetical protein
VDGVTRLPVVAVRSSPLQGSDKDLGPLSPLPDWNSGETMGMQKDTDITQKAHLGIPSGR